jgi:Arc/MetJ family transcription regulator
MQTRAYDRAYELEVFMRTTLNIEDKLIHKAKEMTGIHEKTHLVRLGLEALIARESSKRLAKLGGTERKLRTVPRRRGPVVKKNGSR